MTRPDLLDPSAQVCPSCHGDLGPLGCGCRTPWARGEPDHTRDERALPSLGWAAVYAGPPQGLLALYTEEAPC